MRKNETTNTFNDGMVMDINPLVTPNNVLVNCLNGTLITYNGNEYVLQNDMGNGRVELAYLPQGYIPVGITEFGGIIYIVSYNPLIDKCQIGSFPSPQEVMAQEEINPIQQSLDNIAFQNTILDGNIKTALVKLKLIDKTLHPGDQFLVYTTGNQLSQNKNNISDYGSSKINSVPRKVKLSLVSIDDNNKITYLDDSLKWFKFDKSKQEGYFIPQLLEDEGIPDIDKYRTLTDSGYNVFTSKVSGQLYLLAELETIDSFNVTNELEILSNYIRDIDDISANYPVNIPKINSENIEGLVTNLTYPNTLKLYTEFSWNSSNLELINPKYIILTKSECQGSCSTTASQNDGIEITNELIQTHINQGGIKVFLGYLTFDKSNNPFYTYKMMPAMSFGKLPLYEVTKTIDLNKYGSGEVELTEWRYNIIDSKLYLSWGLSTYLKDDESIESLDFVFIPYDNNSEIIGSITGKSSYDGSFTEIITLKDEIYSPPSEDTPNINEITLQPNYLYLVGIKINIKNKTSLAENNVMITRWLYTNGVFNSLYSEKDIFDYDNEQVPLELSVNLQPGADSVVPGGNESKYGVVQSKNTETNYCSKNSLEDYQRRATIKHHIDRECRYTANASLKDSYNTYSIDTDYIDYSFQIVNKDYEFQTQYYKDEDIINIDNIPVEISEYITPNKGTKINNNWALEGNRIWENKNGEFNTTLYSSIDGQQRNSFTLKWYGESYQNVYMQQEIQNNATVMASLVYNSKEAEKLKLSFLRQWDIFGRIPGAVVGGYSTPYDEKYLLYSGKVTIQDTRFVGQLNFNDGTPYTHSEIFNNVNSFIEESGYGASSDSTICYPFAIDYNHNSRIDRHVIDIFNRNENYKCFLEDIPGTIIYNNYSPEDTDLNDDPKLLLLSIKAADNNWYLLNFAAPIQNKQQIRGLNTSVGNILFCYFSNFYRLFDTDISYYKPTQYLYSTFNIIYNINVNISGKYSGVTKFKGIELSTQFLNSKMSYLQNKYSGYKHISSSNNNIVLNVLAYNNQQVLSKTIEINEDPDNQDWFSNKCVNIPVVGLVSDGKVRYFYTSYDKSKIYGFDGNNFSNTIMKLNYTLNPVCTDTNTQYNYFYLLQDSIKSIDYTNPFIISDNKIVFNKSQAISQFVHITQEYTSDTSYYDGTIGQATADIQIIPELAPYD